MKNVFQDMLQAQMTTMQEAMQTTMKNNMDAFASFQIQFQKVFEAQNAAFSKTFGPGLMDIMKQEAARVTDDIKKAADAIAAGK